jgi:hypothetical protein
LSVLNPFPDWKLNWFVAGKANWTSDDTFDNENLGPETFDYDKFDEAWELVKLDSLFPNKLKVFDMLRFVLFIMSSVSFPTEETDDSPSNLNTGYLGF